METQEKLEGGSKRGRYDKEQNVKILKKNFTNWLGNKRDFRPDQFGDIHNPQGRLILFLH